MDLQLQLRNCMHNRKKVLSLTAMELEKRLYLCLTNSLRLHFDIVVVISPQPMNFPARLRNISLAKTPSWTNSDYA